MSLKKTTVKGILSIGSSTIVRQFINLLITMILAKLLTPKDFGLVGMVTIFTGFISVFANLGLGSAIVQGKEINQTQLSTLFWVGVLSGVAAVSILSLVAYPISLFYKEPQLVKLIVAFSLCFLIIPFYQINRKLVEKELKFGIIALVSIIAIFCSGATGVLAAFLKMGVWSLVIQSISLNLFYLILFRKMKSWTPALVFDLKNSRKHIRFGFNMIGSYLTDYLSRNIDLFLIGKMLGTVTLGYYSLAYRVMYLPVRQVSNIFVQVLFPVFSKIQDRIEALKEGYLKSIRFASLITFPAMTLVFLLNEQIVLFFFGEKWLVAAAIMKILAPAGAVYSLVQIGAALFPAIGKPNIKMKIGILNFILLASSIIIGVRWGIKGVTYGILITAILVFLISQFLINKLLKISFFLVLREIGINFFGCFILFWVDLLLKTNFTMFTNKNIYIFIFQIIIYIMLYFLFIFPFSKKEILYLLHIFRSK